jgi:IS30 family transposase
VHEKLEAGYSPEQIAGRLHYEYPACKVSHEAIYQYIYSQYHRGGYGACTGTDLRPFLKRRHKVRYRKKTLFLVQKGVMRNRVSIDARPAIVDTRREPGHWEGDSMVSRKSLAALNTMVERTTGFVFISKLRDTTGKETARVVVRRLCRIPQRLRRTLTLDNGFENARHEEIARTLTTQIYFAHPYHSWERGTNENTNGLIRWYLPKGTDFATIPEHTISSIEYRLNTRPRKRLGWRTPLEAFNSLLLH